jgi:hypothetical protein
VPVVASCFDGLGLEGGREQGEVLRPEEKETLVSLRGAAVDDSGGREFEW